MSSMREIRDEWLFDLYVSWAPGTSWKCSNCQRQFDHPFEQQRELHFWFEVACAHNCRFVDLCTWCDPMTECGYHCWEKGPVLRVDLLDSDGTKIGVAPPGIQISEGMLSVLDRFRQETVKQELKCKARQPTITEYFKKASS